MEGNVVDHDIPQQDVLRAVKTVIVKGK